MIKQRAQSLAAAISTPLLVSKKEHILFLTGHSFIDGCLLVYPKADRKQPIFLGFGLEHPRGLRSAPFAQLLKQLNGYKAVSVEDSISVKEMDRLKKMAPKIQWKAIPCPVIALREVKSEDELERLRQVNVLTASVFDIIKRKLKSQQWTEIGLARYIRVWGLELGADDVSFEPIVAAGKNSAVPHHHPTEAVIKAGEPIVLDFGFKLDGYCSDFTRTVFLKRAPAAMKQVYNHVEAAYLASVQAARSGMTGTEVDSIARSYLKHVKLEKYFIHSLGHGTGLEVHELPYVGPYADNVLADGMVFSIEPGVYIPNNGGVRIEDLVYMEHGQVHRFVTVPTVLTDNIIK